MLQQTGIAHELSWRRWEGEKRWAPPSQQHHRWCGLSSWERKKPTRIDSLCGAFNFLLVWACEFQNYKEAATCCNPFLNCFFQSVTIADRKVEVKMEFQKRKYRKGSDSSKHLIIQKSNVYRLSREGWWFRYWRFHDKFSIPHGLC